MADWKGGKYDLHGVVLDWEEFELDFSCQNLVLDVHPAPVGRTGRRRPNTGIVWVIDAVSSPASAEEGCTSADVVIAVEVFKFSVGACRVRAKPTIWSSSEDSSSLIVTSTCSISGRERFAARSVSIPASFPSPEHMILTLECRLNRS